MSSANTGLRRVIGLTSPVWAPLTPSRPRVPCSPDVWLDLSPAFLMLTAFLVYMMVLLQKGNIGNIARNFTIFPQPNIWEWHILRVEGIKVGQPLTSRSRTVSEVSHNGNTSVGGGGGGRINKLGPWLKAASFTFLSAALRVQAAVSGQVLHPRAPVRDLPQQAGSDARRWRVSTFRPSVQPNTNLHLEQWKIHIDSSALTNKHAFVAISDISEALPFLPSQQNLRRELIISQYDFLSPVTHWMIYIFNCSLPFGHLFFVFQSFSYLPLMHWRILSLDLFLII